MLAIYFSRTVSYIIIFKSVEYNYQTIYETTGRFKGL